MSITKATRRANYDAVLPKTSRRAPALSQPQLCGPAHDGDERHGACRGCWPPEVRQDAGDRGSVEESLRRQQ